MKNALSIQVGRRIKALREQKGLTQAQLAQLTLKSVETISNFERGTVTPGLVALDILAKKLGCSIRDFFDETAVVSNDTADSQSAQTILNALELLEESDLEILAGLAEVLEKRNRQ